MDHISITTPAISTHLTPSAPTVSLQPNCHIQIAIYRLKLGGACTAAASAVTCLITQLQSLPLFHDYCLTNSLPESTVPTGAVAPSCVTPSQEDPVPRSSRLNTPTSTQLCSACARVPLSTSRLRLQALWPLACDRAAPRTRAAIRRALRAEHGNSAIELRGHADLPTLEATYRLLSRGSSCGSDCCAAAACSSTELPRKATPQTRHRTDHVMLPPLRCTSLCLALPEHRPAQLHSCL